MVIVTQDPLAAVIIALTVPIIPLFMVLIGRYTQARVDRQWATLGVLSGHFLDVVAGLPTLKIFNRAKAQVATIRAVGDQYRASTMGVLRISFLSSLVLELLASLSVAIIAVSIGLRLVEGTMELSTGLAVLILAPEVYLPLRLVGQHFHAAADGVGAAERMFEVLEADAPPRGDRGGRRSHRHDPGARPRCDVRRPGRGRRGLVRDPARAGSPPIVGPSGCGKSTILSVLLGLVGPPTATVEGVVEVVDGAGNATALAELDPAAWRAQIGWVPQSPAMLGGTVADNVRFGRDGIRATPTWPAPCARPVSIPTSSPNGLATAITEGGAGVSVGQARRIGVARALLADPAILLFDEPTAALDGTREAEVGATVADLAARGRTVVVVTHRQSLVDLADDVVVLAPAEAGGAVGRRGSGDRGAGAAPGVPGDAATPDGVPRARTSRTRHAPGPRHDPTTAPAPPVAAG